MKLKGPPPLSPPVRSLAVTEFLSSPVQLRSPPRYPMHVFAFMFSTRTPAPAFVFLPLEVALSLSLCSGRLICQTGLARPTRTPPACPGLVAHLLPPGATAAGWCFVDSARELLLEQGALLTLRPEVDVRERAALPEDRLLEKGQMLILSYAAAAPSPPFLSLCRSFTSVGFFSPTRKMSFHRFDPVVGEHEMVAVSSADGTSGGREGRSRSSSGSSLDLGPGGASVSA